MISDAAAGGHADDVGGRQQLGGLAAGLAPRRADPHGDRHLGGRAMRSTQLVEAVVGDDRAGAVELEDERRAAPLSSAVVDRRLDEVDEHRVEQPADLDDGDVAVAPRAPCAAAARPRSGPSERPARPDSDGYGGQTGPR